MKVFDTRIEHKHNQEEGADEAWKLTVIDIKGGGQTTVVWLYAKVKARRQYMKDNPHHAHEDFYITDAEGGIKFKSRSTAMIQAALK